MALETGTYISDLVATNPVSGDPVSQADDHLRLLKSTVKNTFPNITGAVTATHTALNDAAQRVLTSGTVTATTTGTTVDFTSIPSWVKRITLNMDGVSLSGTDTLLLQIGDSGGIETTGYATTNASIANGAASTVAERTDGWGLQSNAANGLFTGTVFLNLLDVSTNKWTASGSVARGNGNANMFVIAGSKGTSATLDRIRLTPSGTNTFDAGSVNILYE